MLMVTNAFVLAQDFASLPVQSVTVVVLFHDFSNTCAPKPMGSSPLVVDLLTVQVETNAPVAPTATGASTNARGAGGPARSGTAYACESGAARCARTDWSNATACGHDSCDCSGFP